MAFTSLINPPSHPFVSGSLFLVTIASLLSFPYTIFAIYYQAAVIRKWCPYCLLVTISLWIETVISVIYLLEYNVMIPDASEVLLLTLSFAIPLLLWIYMKDMLYENSSNKKVKNQFHRLISNINVFNTLHTQFSEVDADFKGNHITIGASDAKHTLSLVMNIDCPSCINTCMKVLDILPSYEGELRFKIIFAKSPSESITLSDRFITNILDQYYSLEESKFVLFLKETLKDYNTERTFLPQSKVASEKAIATIKSHTLWLKNAGIIQTPALILNNRVLSSYYSVQELKYILPFLPKEVRSRQAA